MITSTHSFEHLFLIYGSGCPYCQFSSTATSGFSAIERKAWHQQAKKHMNPVHPTYMSCVAYVRMTLLLASTARRIVSITTIGAFAGKLLFGESFSSSTAEGKYNNAKKKSLDVLTMAMGWQWLIW